VELRLGDRALFAVVLHLGSKGGDDRLAGAVQPPRLRSEAKRSEQARLVAELAGQLLSTDPQALVVVLGDLNDFPWRPPLARFAEAGLVSLMPRLPPADRYSFIFEGNSQVLDHVLVSPALAAAFDGIDAVHRHADFPAASRPSDHDPVVARFRLP
jgi:predicted extracellular nuclease